MKKKLRSAFLLESLEARLLFSADLAPVPVDGGNSGAEVESGLEISLRPDSGGVQEGETIRQDDREVIFVDEAVDDSQQLIADLESQFEKGSRFNIVGLDSDHDGIAQISAYLNQQQDVAAVHIISHGADGEVFLGNSRLNATTLEGYAEAIEGWQRALSSDADLLFYGCNLAVGDDGQDLVNSLTLLTGADVAASDDVTGSAQFGGNWELEYGKGEIETAVALSSETQQNWNGVLAVFTVTNTADSGAGSLRKAIIDANALGGTDTINFDIPLDDLKHYYFKDDGSGNSLSLVAVTDLNDASIADFDPDYPGTPYSWFSIKPSSILPAITDPVILDATTQPGYAGKPIIELDGTDVSGSDSNGLTIQGGNSTVRGLVINRFQGTLADAIEIEINGGNTIAGNYIGTDVTGTQQKGNLWGINLKSADNLVGGTNAADRNVISGNDNEGFYIYTATASGNFLSGNYIGVDATGSAPLGNGSHGVYITSSASNTTIVGNVISGNTGHGIAIDKDDGGNIIEGNLIGTDVDGLVDLGNTLNGVDINDSANNRIGGKTPGAGNLISGNDDWGIHLDRGGATGNNVFGNLIGTDAKGTGGIGNLSGGVKVKGSATDNLIGGHFPGEGNIIAFNVGEGVNISSGTNRIRTNIIFDNGGATFDITLTGGNTNADMPSVSGAISGGGTTDVTVWLSGADANQSYRVDLFSNPTNEAEGQVYLGTVVLTTDGSGNASQLFTLNNEVPNGHYITATASNAISGTSAFCTMTIVSGPLSTNTAPLLDPTADVLLNEVNEDAGPPSGVVGTLISDLVDLNPPAGGNDNVSDPDIGTIPGIAIISAETDNGAWFYSTDNGASWFALGAVAIDSARLLAADGSTRIYFEPNPGFSGTVSSAIYFRAWDQTTGTNGDLADTTVHGGTAAFSLLFDSAAISVNTVNNDPGTVSISNTTPAQGDTLTAGVTDPDGASGAIAYQWQRDGADIGGATTNTYTTVQADVGAVITVVASYTDDLGFDESVSSAPTAAVTNVNDPGTVSISNTTPAQGDTLTAGVTDPDGASGAIAYQWQRDGADIGGATTNTYTTVQADVGAVITVVASYTDDLGFDESVSSAPTAAVTNVNDPGTVSISNTTPAQGDTLTAGVTDPDGASGAIAYQWQRDGADIGGATTNTYTTVQADVGAVITVVASYTDDLGFDESVSSAPTAAVTNVNDPGTVSISNTTPAQGDTLTAGVTDPDGASGAIAYQWQRDGADIGGATTNTYTTVQADVGAVITVVASYTDDLGFDESVSSAPTAAVTNVNDPGTVSISNTTPAQGDTLTAGVTDPDGASGAIAYQWQRDGADIGGATTNTYTTVQADVGAVITVVASYTDDLGFDESVSSAPTAAVTNVNDPGTVSISNTTPAQGDTLTAGVTDPDGASGAIAYQWQRDGADIGGATTNTYTTVQADVGAVITVVASYTDDLGFDESVSSAPTAAVTNVNDPGTVSISNTTPAQGDTLTAGVTDPDGASGAIAYQWQRDGADIGGATTNTYTTVQADVGAVITVVASYTDDLGFDESVSSAPTAAVTNVNDPGTVSISNTTPAQGDTLTAGVTDPDGASGAIAYQWQRDGADIGGATTNTYTTVQADVGAVITVVASYTDDLGFDESVSSAPTAAVTNVNDPGTVSISNTTPAQGDTLTAGVTDPDGASGAIAYQWQRDGADIGGATTNTYTTVQADVGAVITVVASYTDDLGFDESVSSAPTAAVTNVNDPGTVSISNTTPAQGDTLTAGVTDPDGASGAIAYQWQRDGADIGGATTNTYTTVQADVGAVITVVASYTDDLGFDESVSSAPTAAVTNVNDPGTVSISNTTPAQGDTLTAGVTDPDGASGAIAYQWQRDGADIGGATTNTYTTVQADVGAVITVVASYTDDLGFDESVSSAPTAAVTNVNDPGTVSISNTTPAQGDTLTAGVTDPDGASGAIAYQWQRDGADIGGATTNTYTTVQADVGAVITVVASYTDDLGFDESVSSAPTAAVTNVNDPGTVSISNTTPAQGDTLTAGVTDPDGASGAIAYQWQRDGADIGGATTNTYTTVQADVGAVITVSAIYTDDLSGAESLISAPTAAVTNVNETPIAVNDSLTVTEDYSMTFNSVTDLLGNDSDIDGDTLTLSGFTQPANGILVDNGDGTLTYTPAGNFNGTDNFTYTISDGNGGTAIGMAIIVVTPVGDTPQVTNVSTNAEVQSGFIFINRNASDGPEVTHFKISGITNGTLYLADGVTRLEKGDYITAEQGQAGLKFTPAAGSTADGSFNVESSEDGVSVASQSGIATSIITVMTPASLASEPEQSPPKSDPEQVVSEEIVEEEEESEDVEDVADETDVQADADNMLSVETAQPTKVSGTAKPSFNPGIAFLKRARLDSDDDKTPNSSTRLSPQTLKMLIETDNLGELKAALKKLGITTLSPEEYELVRSSLDAIKDEMGKEILLGKTVLGSAIATSVGLSAGYVVWMLKGGSLLASLLSSLPAWQLADPLAILVGKKEDEDDDDDSLKTIIEEGSGRDEDKESKASKFDNLRKKSTKR